VILVRMYGILQLDSVFRVVMYLVCSVS